MDRRVKARHKYPYWIVASLDVDDAKQDDVLIQLHLVANTRAQAELLAAAMVDYGQYPVAVMLFVRGERKVSYYSHSGQCVVTMKGKQTIIDAILEPDQWAMIDCAMSSIESQQYQVSQGRCSLN